jgi:hypothetical protein
LLIAIGPFIEKDYFYQLGKVLAFISVCNIIISGGNTKPMNNLVNKLELITITTRIPKPLKEEAEEFIERHGDFSRMVSEGLSMVIADRRRKRAIRENELKAS